MIALGAPLLAAGSVLTTQVTSEWGLIAAFGVLSAAGAGAGSFSILMGATAQHLPPERRAFASGFINAGGSFGQFVFAPLNQAVMSAFGWMHALWMMAVAALATAPLAWLLGNGKPAAATPVTGAAAPAAIDADAARAAAHRCARPQLLVPARGLLHLRLSHRLPGHASAGRGESVRTQPAGRGDIAGHHRPVQHRRQPRLQARWAITCA